MPSDSKRLHEVYTQIEQIKAGEYPAIVGRDDQYRIVDRPWAEIPEPSKLAMLQDAVDWSGITNRDQANILLSEVDPGKPPDAQRNRLIDAAVVGHTLKDILDGKVEVAPPEAEREKGIERGGR